MVSLLVAGNVKVDLLKYKKDARSIPVTGDMSSVTGIGTQSSFSIQENKLMLSDPENGTETVTIGDHMQYTVNSEQI